MSKMLKELWFPVVLVILVVIFFSMEIEEKREVRDSTVQTEICYKGVSYVKFNSGRRSWGSVMQDINGSNVPCH